MAFTFTLLKKELLPGGLVKETGTWSLAAVTTGNITVDTATQPEIIKISSFDLASDSDVVVLPALDVADTTLKITGTSGDTGDYTIIGAAA